MTKTIIGVDPGLTGALSFYDVDTKTLKCYPMPIRSVPYTRMVKGKSKKGTRDEVDQYAMAVIVKENCDVRDTMAFVEKVSAGAFSSNGTERKQGVTSAYRFGCGYGVIQGVLAGVGFQREQVVFVHPATWKNKLGLIGQTKKESIALACKLFPCNVVDFTVNPVTQRKKEMDGVAESALITHYGLNYGIV